MMSVKSKAESCIRLEPISSAYIHVPFCSYKCDFCDFAAFAGLNHREEEYFNALKQEIKERCLQTESRVNLSSIYFGGGTPGMVPPHFIEEVLSLLSSTVETNSDLEICLETTPHSITEEKLRAWADMGIRRLSVGIESLNDAELSSIGRDHTKVEALEGLKMALKSEMKVVSADFMYGLPTQTLDSWISSLNEIMEIASNYGKLKHVSAYGLQLAEKSPLYSRFPKDSTSYPDEELFEKMLFKLIEILRANGFEHYEVSNFAKPESQCRHNSTYWKNKPYLAFGVGAHRYVDGWRSSNYRSFNKYVRDFMHDETSEFITDELKQREAIMLGLRMRRGICLNSFEQEFGFSLLELKSTIIERLVADGYLVKENGFLSITDKGLPVSNSVIVELI